MNKRQISQVRMKIDGYVNSFEKFDCGSINHKMLAMARMAWTLNPQSDTDSSHFNQPNFMQIVVEQICYRSVQ